MKNVMLSPSLFVGNLLNIEDDIRQCDKAGADMFHIDMIDTTFTTITGLPNALLPAIRQVSQTPLDIHIMSAIPEVYFPTILPYCENSYVVMHIETAKEFNWLANQVRQAKGKPGVTLNSTTPVCAIKEVLPMVDMVQVMLCDAGREMKIPGLKEHIYHKIPEIRKMCDEIGRPDIVIQCDGGVTFEMAKLLMKHGANSFVLGRDSIFAQKESVSERIFALRKFLAEE